MWASGAQVALETAALAALVVSETETEAPAASAVSALAELELVVRPP